MSSILPCVLTDYLKLSALPPGGFHCVQILASYLNDLDHSQSTPWWTLDTDGMWWFLWNIWPVKRSNTFVQKQMTVPSVQMDRKFKVRFVSSPSLYSQMLFAYSMREISGPTKRHVSFIICLFKEQRTMVPTPLLWKFDLPAQLEGACKIWGACYQVTITCMACKLCTERGPNQSKCRNLGHRDCSLENQSSYDDRGGFIFILSRVAHV